MRILAIGAGLFGLMIASPALAADAGQQMMAQNTYDGGAVASQDSLLGAAPAGNGYAVLRQATLNAENNVSVHLSALHFQYHENATEGTGDDENGFAPGFGISASVLLPQRGLPTDYYAALIYDFSAGNFTYGGHYLESGLPATATDRAVLNRVEARLGVGVPLIGGAELIPFAAFGYQAWNRNDDLKGAIGSDELYTSGLAGAGLKLDLPVSPVLVLSGTAEMLALIGANVDNDGFGLSHSMGISGEERVTLGLDYAVHGALHVTAAGYYEHFNYAGFRPSAATYYLYEPLSTTTQIGGDVGLAYSF